MSWKNILKSKCFYCGKNPCECVDESANDMPRKNLEQDLKDKETDKEGVLVAGALRVPVALMGGKEDE